MTEEEEREFVRERCRTRNKHVVVTVVDASSAIPTVYYACPSCDRLWEIEPLIGLIERTPSADEIRRVRRAAGLET